MAQAIDLGTERRPATKVIKRGLKLPDWLATYLVNGNKIAAIKTVRELYVNHDGRRMGLGAAKSLVEEFGIVTDTTYEDDYRA